MRQKHKRYSENFARENVLEPGKELFEKIKGNWRSTMFGNGNDLVVELGCGKGEYTIGLSRVYPDRNFIGIDIKGDRIWVGSKMAEDEKLGNVAFLRTQLHYFEKFFEEGEVSEMWLTFPDPRPRDRDEKRRLTFPRYLNLYKHALKKDGWFKFKTDNTPLFDWTLEVLEQQFPVRNLSYTHDLYESDLMSEHFGIQTKYEKLFSDKGEKIKYMKFQF
ncbi:MAG: tRNA (guanosine(46)-N7)-methyltransferase TrmB [Cytophagales bacterium]|nr:tRNA (guanosine(46)-N7)-methyltransferase TrmB [Cytophagales bacterium]